MRHALLSALLVLSAIAPLPADEKHEKLLYPVVRVKTDRAGGSGVVIYSEERKEGAHRTYILTNHHVIAEAVKVTRQWDHLSQQFITKEKNDLVDVELFSWYKGKIVDRKTVRAAAIAHSEDHDIAVLELRSGEDPYPIPAPFIATLATPAQAKKLQIFQEIYAVGCSLGHDPIHSKGDISDLDDLIDGKRYMMGSAPIIFGNSGGHVSTSIDDEWVVIGIPSRVAVAYGAIPHMNWFVPTSRIREFMKEQKLTFFVDPEVSPEETFAAREKEREDKHHKRE